MKNKQSNPEQNIKYLFEPHSFAVIGASSNQKKIGFTIINNIIQGGYQGKIYPINPNGGEILGHKVYKNITDVKDEIDVVSIVVPAKFVLKAIEDCSAKKVKFAQIITSGFSEVGNTEEEEEIVAIANKNGMRILGPNIFGLYSSKKSLNSTFSGSNINSGGVAILTQSGALGIAMIGKTIVNNIGLSSIVSIGNKCDLDETDLLEYLVPQKETKVILMYIEGVKNGERLIKALKKATQEKPVIVIKSGRSSRGAMAAASHTGSLAGSDDVFDAVMKQCGVLRAETLEEAFNWSKFLSASPHPKGSQAVIVTNGGGIGVMATDACEKYQVNLFDDQPTLEKIFQPVTPSFGSVKNPIDITGGANSEDYTSALTAPTKSKEMDATIALYCETATFDSENLSSMIKNTHEQHLKAKKPITYAIVGGETVEKSITTLKKENIPVFGDVDQAVSCLGILYKYQNHLKEKDFTTSEADLDLKKINQVIDRALANKRNFLLANEAANIMQAAGINIPLSKIARNIDEAVNYAEEIGYPLVMKVVSKDILHKSDAGGVALNLLNKEEVIDAYEAIGQNCKKYKAEATIEGIEICEMIQGGVEFVVGGIRDASFGPVVMAGLGGIYVEIMKDVTFRSIPLNRKEAMTMLNEIRSFPLLMGVRGEPPKDIEGVIDTIIKVATILQKCNRITDIEINPIVVYEKKKGLKALDARILIKEL